MRAWRGRGRPFGPRLGLCPLTATYGTQWPVYGVLLGSRRAAIQAPSRGHARPACRGTPMNARHCWSPARAGPRRPRSSFFRVLETARAVSRPTIRAIYPRTYR